MKSQIWGSNSHFNMPKHDLLAKILNLLRPGRSSAVQIPIDPQDLNPSLKAVARYFGGPDYPLVGKTRQRIDAGIKQALAIVKPMVSYRAIPVDDIDEFPHSHWTEEVLAQIFCGESDSHAQYLAVYVGTLGSTLETTCRDLATRNQIYQSLLLDAVGTAMLDKLSTICNDIVSLHAKQLGCFSGCRLGPGLNGIPLESHALLFELLGQQSAGVCLNEAFIMLPAKSITAFSVMSDTEQPKIPGNKCQHCTMQHCQFRTNRHH